MIVVAYEYYYYAQFWNNNTGLPAVFKIPGRPSTHKALATKTCLAVIARQSSQSGSGGCALPQ